MNGESIKDEYMNKMLTIVVPCFNEEEAIPIFYETILKEIHKIEMRYPTILSEIIFIDDGSKDASLREMKDLHIKDNRVKYVSFSRNFGKEAALYAGLQKAEGDYIVTMDVDLQDPPELLLEMLEAIIDEDYDSAATRRVNRKGEPVVRSFLARQFYKVINAMSNTEIVDGARDYRMMNRKMVNAILAIGERNRFTKGIYGWIGFKTKWIEFQNVERIAGETKWNFWKLFSYAIEGIIAYSTFPLSFIMFLGIIISLIEY